MPVTTSPVQTTPPTEVDDSTDVAAEQPSSPTVETTKPVIYSGYSNKWCYVGETVFNQINNMVEYQLSQGAHGPCIVKEGRALIHMREHVSAFFCFCGYGHVSHDVVRMHVRKTASLGTHVDMGIFAVCRSNTNKFY